MYIYRKESKLLRLRRENLLTCTYFKTSSQYIQRQKEAKRVRLRLVQGCVTLCRVRSLVGASLWNGFFSLPLCPTLSFYLLQATRLFWESLKTKQSRKFQPHRHHQQRGIIIFFFCIFQQPCCQVILHKGILTGKRKGERHQKGAMLPRLFQSQANNQLLLQGEGKNHHHPPS